ncbi:hypothetical protein [uncultured Roseobacter sp.]|uniref:hypothetical protein n=1 Tax=uncultured Roseobacter sp. TaxID=114847 RepID=UPI00262E46D8|nr:hypothetical protein [uncultured Roseobacter sp.]
MSMGLSLRHRLRLGSVHPYYGVGAPLALPITPMGSTAQDAPREGYRWHSTDKGLDLYSDVSGDDAAGALPGLFRIGLGAEFEAVTRAGWTGQIDRTSLLFLSDADATLTDGRLEIDTGTGHILPIHNPVFRFRADAPLAAAKPALLRWRDRTPVWEGTETPAGMTALDITAHGLADGRYLLVHDDKTLLDAFLTSVPGPQLSCVLDLDLAGLLDNSGDVVTVAPRFETRACTWRYVVRALQPGKDLSASTLRASQPSVGFDAALRQRLDGQEVWVFNSSTPLPLIGSTPGDLRIDFVHAGAPGKREQAVSMPLAGAQTVQAERADGEVRFVAIMHVMV